MLDRLILGGAVGLGVLLTAWFSGRADGVKDTNLDWEKRKAAYEKLATDTAHKEFEAREKGHEKVTEKTNTVLKETKVYYETAPNPVCLDESRSVFIGDSRRAIAASGGSRVAGEGNAPAGRPEESPNF